MSRRSLRACALASPCVLALALAGCGAGTAAAVSSGGSSGGGNAPGTLGGLLVLHPKVPHEARVRFVLTDVENDPQDVELSYQVGGGPRVPLTQLASNPMTLSASPAGVEHVLPWNFAAESELPDDGSFVSDVRVIAALRNGVQEIVLGANGDLGLGNDAPVVSDPLPPAQEVRGVVPVRFHLADSSGDIVSVEIEYDVVGDDPDLGWRDARPGGLPAAQPTPTLAFAGVEAPVEGTSPVFFWDTDVDLADLERDVRLRFVASDDVLQSATATTPVFRVDNNAEPIVTVSGDLLLLNPDRRRGIPIPFTVRDAESDSVELVFQWKHPDDSYAPLPATPAEIRTLLADPVQRREFRICSEFATGLSGTVATVDADSVRLPDLAVSAAAHTRGVVGRELEIFRSSQVPRAIAATWPANPLAAPATVLPLANGIEALVLDRAGSSAWRLYAIDLSTGAVTRVHVASSAGRPNTMTLEPGERSVLVASDIAGAWRVARVDLADGAVAQLIAFDGSTPAGEIRGLARLGTHVLLATVDDCLLRLDYSNPREVLAMPLFAGLATPWGIALDGVRTDRIFLAERDAVIPGSPQLGRISTVDLDRGEIRAFSIAADDGTNPCPYPEALCFDRNAHRLIAVTSAGPGSPRALREMDAARAIADSSHEVASALAGAIGSVASGRDALLVAALTDASDLAVGGGVEQSRSIESYDFTRQLARVTEAFDPPLGILQRYRIRAASSIVRASPEGVARAFVWDSDEVAEGGDVLVRAVPMDAEVGVEGGTAGPKELRSRLDTDPVRLGNVAETNDPRAVAAADLDGDGDVDIVSANRTGDTLAIFFQAESGAFDAPPLVLGGIASTNGPIAVAVADFDRDTDLDVVSANRDANRITVFFQTAPGVFNATPLVLGTNNLTPGPSSVAAADIDGDGDQDIASTNVGNSTLTVFRQSSPGVFAQPIRLGNQTLTPFPRGLAIADLNADGRLDLATGIYAPEGGFEHVAIFFQTTPGAFVSIPATVAGSQLYDGASDVAAEDLDGDGDNDLVAVVESLRIKVFLQTRPGSFEELPQTLGSLTTIGYLARVSIADIDGDGRPDIVSSNPAVGTNTIFFQTDTAVFRDEPAHLGRTSPTDQPHGHAIADVDADGDLDLVVANGASNDLSIFHQSDPGAFSAEPTLLGNVTITAVPLDVQAADFDSDGDLDVISSNSNSHTLTIFTQTVPGAFSATPITLPTGLQSFPVGVAPADLDGDGDLDLVTAHCTGLSLYFQERTLTFGPPVSLTFTQPSCPQDLIVADLDGDGDLDIVVTDIAADRLVIFRRTASGTFEADPITLPTPSSSAGIDVADLDGDGDLDIVNTNVLADQISIFFQASPGVFGPAPHLLGSSSVTDGARAVAAADIDGDGDIDLVATNQEADTLTVFFQSSPGAFEEEPLVLGNAAVIEVPYDVDIADVDHDGDLDLVSTNSFTGTITVFFQTSRGVFAPVPLSIGELGYITGGATADVDGDGELDLLTVDQTTSNVAIFWGGR